MMCYCIHSHCFVQTGVRDLQTFSRGRTGPLSWLDIATYEYNKTSMFRRGNVWSQDDVVNAVSESFVLF